MLAITWTILRAPGQAVTRDILSGCSASDLRPLLSLTADPLRSGRHWCIDPGSQLSCCVRASVAPVAPAPPQKPGVGLHGTEGQGWPGLGESEDEHEGLLALLSHVIARVQHAHGPGGETKALQEEGDTVRASTVGPGLQPRSPEAWSVRCGCGGESSFILSSSGHAGKLREDTKLRAGCCLYLKCSCLP